MTAAARRGACPGLAAPMPTGDGLLVRMMPAEPIGLRDFVALCGAARLHGNGTIEVSARGSLQVRGLNAVSAPRFAEAVAGLDIAVPEGVPVVTGPLDDAGDALIDSPVLAMRLRGAIADEFAGAARGQDAAAQPQSVLAPKISLVIDHGGALHLDAVTADIRLRATGTARSPGLAVGVGGDAAAAAWLGSIAPEQAGEAVLGLLREIAAHGPAARAADVLRRRGHQGFQHIVRAFTTATPIPPPRPRSEPIGVHRAQDGTFVVGVALAFGHARADALADLAAAATDHGARGIRPAPGRVLMLCGLSAENARGLREAAARAGLITAADDPRRSIVACPGAPACASGHIPARAIGAEIGSRLAHGAGSLDAARSLPVSPLPTGGDPAGSRAPESVQAAAALVHVSGCPKGCAHPGPAAITVVGTQYGCAIVRNGTARAAPIHFTRAPDVASEVARMLTRDDARTPLREAVRSAAAEAGMNCS